ncbi:MAG: D-alanyl-D-alanine carboxypeptidase family protein [Herminiimonas sp.]|nr:D-alanyl-D-alanine carboxypeptidase family protein [Herminiimonas sp.]
MRKTAVGVLFSVLSAMFIATPVMAKQTEKTASVKKQAAKKASAPKSAGKIAARSGSKNAAGPAVPKMQAAANRRQAKKNRVSVTLDSRERLERKVALVGGKRKIVYQRAALAPVVPAVPPVTTAGDLAGLNLTRDPLDLKSNVALVMDQATSEVLFEKNSQAVLPIASITKLMTSLIVVEANQDMNEVLTVTEEDIDREKFTHSRLRIGSQLTRANMLHIALMSSENRAASALGRHYPGGLPAFVAAMNAKARMLGMTGTRYVDSTGLSRLNVSSARDLAKLVVVAHRYPVIREYSTNGKYAVEPGGPPLQYKNSNHLVLNPEWEIGLQKTGYIAEAGRCLVMQTKIEGRSVVMVFLDSKGKESRIADAGRVRRWLENVKGSAMNVPAAIQNRNQS